MGRYLIHFLDEWLDFRYAEFLSLLALNGLDAERVILTHNREAALRAVHEREAEREGNELDDKALLQRYVQFLREKPDPLHFLVVELPSDEAARTLAARAVLIKTIYELWSQADSLPQLVEKMSLQDTPVSQFPQYFRGAEGESAGPTWCVQVLTFGRTFTMSDKESMRLHFKPLLPFRSPVRLKNPELELWLILDFQGKPDFSRLAVNDPLRRRLLTQNKGNEFANMSIEEALAAQMSKEQEEEEEATRERAQQEEKAREEREKDGLHIERPAYFARKVCDAGMKEALRKYDLKQRPYIGPTSLDHGLALILCNIAQVHANMCAYEPFIGTGSIAIALAHLGSVVFGSDIDPRVLRGDMHAGKDAVQEHLQKNRAYYEELKKQKEAEKTRQNASAADSAPAPAPTVPPSVPSDAPLDKHKQGLQSIHASTRKANAAPAQVPQKDVFTNFRHYGLPLPELIRMDHHLLDRHFRFVANSDNGFFDVIVTDPPYGIRAGARKSGKKEALDYTIAEERRHDHIPTTQTYAVEEVMLDLLHTAASSLNMNGVLVYLLPTPYDFTTKDLPMHPCLELTDACHQHLSSRHGRRAIVMRKVRPFTAAAVEEYEVYKKKVLNKEDDGFGSLIDKLQLALAPDAHTNENVVKMVGAGGERRRESKVRRKQQREEGVTFESDKIKVKLLSKKQMKRIEMQKQQELVQEGASEENTAMDVEQNA